MISNEEMKRIAEECGLLPGGNLPKYPVEKFIDYQDLCDELLAFAKHFHKKAQDEQRKADEELCHAIKKREFNKRTPDAYLAAEECADAIRNVSPESDIEQARRTT